MDGQKTKLAEMACSGQKALISRYFFYTDLREFGCDPHYFTMVRREDDTLGCYHNNLDERPGTEVPLQVQVQQGDPAHPQEQDNDQTS